VITHLKLGRKTIQQSEQQFLYTIAEVYNYGISGGQDFDFGTKKNNYFMNGFNNMINFEFKWDAQKTMNLFSLNIQTS
jgi:DNA phosphorothioation-dependent restriction protein DptG